MRTVSVAVGALLLVFTAICYVAEPDACAAITVWPPWVWAVPGLVLTLVGGRRFGRRFLLFACGAWLLYAVILCEEPRSMVIGPLRGRLSPPTPRSQMLRVVSLNCAGGSAAVADEVARYRPDIVLLQESPSKEETEALGRRLFGANAAAVCGYDGSVIARAKVVSRRASRKVAGYAMLAYVRLSRGVSVQVVSLRLTPPAFRVDIWSAANWNEQASLRRTHRREISEMAREMQTLDGAVPLIVGGDFNAPGWDGALKELPSRLEDTFVKGGTGWGNTVLNGFPVLRFDQIWASRHFTVRSARAYRTQHSDHRLVVCDLALAARN